MSELAIKVENLSKMYRLGSVGTGTISQDLNRTIARLRGKEDPYAKVGLVNDRSTKSDGDFVWSLKDINFEIKKGDAVGIIGKNGAGKSTLLKILSRVTGPSTGTVKIKGRVASLLEVGTGFHPELSGRDNIFMNGSILGMSRAEIKSKFDEIVDFSGVEKYIDTPVKRYSSGMYVRLAFAVAAHLEPEILIVDEVLAVGDAEFQKKCLGKMQDVNREEGRTVLFVSHNMAAVNRMCDKGIVLKDGQKSFEGNKDEAIKFYLKDSTDLEDTSGIIEWTKENAPGDLLKLMAIKLMNEYGENNNIFYIDKSISIEIKYLCTQQFSNMRIALQILDEYENVIFTSTNEGIQSITSKAGMHTAKCTIPPDILNKNRYYVFIHFGQPGLQVLLQGRIYTYFDTEIASKNTVLLSEYLPGYVAPKLEWTNSYQETYEK
jgi:lipopolysaccharide transport system ATP-binding protein